MTRIEHPEVFHGLPVLTLSGADDVGASALPSAESVAWRLDCGPDEVPFPDLWQHFLDTVAPARVRALLIGAWREDDYCVLAPVVELLVSAADRFTDLRALFLADVVGEECEVSWLAMCDITPVLEAFPLLEELSVRGGGDSVPEEAKLELRPVRHGSLKSLRFESGGLPGHVVRAVGACELPALERMELWFGVGWYGGDATVEDLRPVLAGDDFPRLRHLGLPNSEIQDEIAAAVPHAPVVARLESLALSMGTLTDAGAEALLNGQPLTRLTSLDLCHHYLTDPLRAPFRELCAGAGTRLDLDGADYGDPEGEEPRYAAVSA